MKNNIKEEEVHVNPPSDTLEFNVPEKSKLQTQKSVFDIYTYKIAFDQFVTEMMNESEPTKLTIDTLIASNIPFPELKDNFIKIVSTSNSGVKYSFDVSEKNSHTKHDVVYLEYDDELIASKWFSKIQQTATEKSGVPGLTYSSDYVFQVDNVIYWIHSSCGYSYQNHVKLVEQFKDLYALKTESTVECECGKVLCVLGS